MGGIPGEYSDMEMMYHYILMHELELTAQQVAGYSIHGLKHSRITAATQLGIERTAIGKLGHWHHNSKMPDKYNQAKRVLELCVEQQFNNNLLQAGDLWVDPNWPMHGFSWTKNTMCGRMMQP